MNIFEALNEGKGRATLPEKSQYYVAMYVTNDFRYNFVWSNDLLRGVHDIELRSNDWIPYVPRETCSNCGQVRPSPKVKPKEVFEDVLWIIDSGQVAREASATIYPHIIKSPLAFDKFAWKKTKMTLEWEE